MKKIFKLSIVLLIAASSVTFTSCLKNSTPTPSNGAVGTSFYWLPSTTDVPNVYYSKVASSTVTELYKLSYQVYAGDAMDPEKDIQLEQMQFFIDEECEAIIFSPIKSTGYSEVVSDAIFSNIHLICVDNELANMGGISGFVGTDNIDAGKVIAENLLGKRATGGEVIIINAAPKMCRDRADGFEDKIGTNSNFNITVIQSDGIRTKDAIKAVEAKIASLAGKNIVGVFGTTDELALGAASVLRENNFKNFELYGVDGSADALVAIVGDKMTATVSQDAEKIGQAAAQMASKAIKGTSYTTPVKIKGKLLQKSDLKE